MKVHCKFWTCVIYLLWVSYHWTISHFKNNTNIFIIYYEVSWVTCPAGLTLNPPLYARQFLQPGGWVYVQIMYKNISNVSCTSVHSKVINPRSLLRYWCISWCRSGTTVTYILRGFNKYTKNLKKPPQSKDIK